MSKADLTWARVLVDTILEAVYVQGRAWFQGRAFRWGITLEPLAAATTTEVQLDPGEGALTAPSRCEVHSRTWPWRMDRP
jgi:hypothetical protein